MPSVGVWGAHGPGYLSCVSFAGIVRSWCVGGGVASPQRPGHSAASLNRSAGDSTLGASGTPCLRRPLPAGPFGGGVALRRAAPPRTPALHHSSPSFLAGSGRRPGRRSSVGSRAASARGLTLDRHRRQSRVYDGSRSVASTAQRRPHGGSPMSQPVAQDDGRHDVLDAQAVTGVLREQGALSAGSISAELDLPGSFDVKQCLRELGVRGLVEETSTIPGRWRLTADGRTAARREQQL